MRPRVIIILKQRNHLESPLANQPCTVLYSWPICLPAVASCVGTVSASVSHDFFESSRNKLFHLSIER